MDKFEKYRSIEKFKNLEETKKRFLEKMTLRTLTQAMYSDVNF